MGHGKETPRQKMIGMMYLVLTALLALNVSADVLNAFILVNEGIVKTTDNFVAKNASAYDVFDAEMDKAAAKVGPFRDAAYDVKKRADQLTYDMQELKVKIIKYVDGEKAPSLVPMDWYVGRPGEKLETYYIDGKEILTKDNMDKPAEIMILNKEGEVLKSKIDEFREHLISLTDENEETVRHTFEEVLNTHSHSEEHSWESSNFEHLPMVAVITNLSKLQSDVRNAEADMIQYLLNKIGATDTKVNKMEAVVLTKSNYILVGGQFEARVLLAAYDSLQKPEILLGKYRRTADGNDWEIPDGGTVLAYDEKGRAMIKRPGSSVGNYTVDGLLRMNTPDGLKNYPFSQEYQVGQPSAVISPTKMNVLYIGVDNPLSISVSGVPAEKVRATINQGNIRKVSGSEYIASPTTTSSDAVVTVFAEIEGQQKSMGTMPFRVKIVPPPVAKVGGKTSGAIEKNVLTSQNGVLADMEDFLFDLRYVISQFTVNVSTAQGDRASTSNSPAFTPEQKSLLNALTKGQVVTFTNVKAKGPDGNKDLKDFFFKIN